MTSQAIENIIISTLKSYQPIYVGLFGSFVRGENSAESDVDVLVKLSKSCSLLQLIAIEQELSNKLGKKVDLVTEASLKNQRVKDSIFHDLKIIYQA